MTSTRYAHHFSLNNLPFGVASSPNHRRQCATRLENTVIFLGQLQQSAFFKEIPSLPEGVFSNLTLNDYAALPKSVHIAVRNHLQSSLKSGGIESLPAESIANVESVTMHMPVEVPAFTDFSCSLNHVRNAGSAILNDPTPPPGFFHFPIGYAGRASTIAVSGTPITRPVGHLYDRSAPVPKTVVYGPSRAMDYEMELGVVVGRPVAARTQLRARDADEHVFGFVVLNDWSARDIQGLEMIPLGPLNGKAFGTSISPWIVTLEALEPFRAAGPEPRVPLPEHLQEKDSLFNYAIDMRVELLHSRSGTGEEAVTSVTGEAKAQEMFWSHRQMCAHLASSGCGLRTGEILGTGTVSGEFEGSYGCLLETTKGGKEVVKLADGGERVYLQDGDVVRMSAVVGGESSGVGFGECVGELLPALS